MNYEKDIEIDGEALDQEWMGQAALMLKYAQHSARMRKLLEEAKQSLDIAKAEADQKIRSNPDKYGIEKITETVVANTILNEKYYKQAYTEFLDTKFESDMAQGAVNAFEHRKSALENLVRLYGQQYFAGPTIPYQINRDWEKKQAKEEANTLAEKGAEKMMRRMQK